MKQVQIPVFALALRRLPPVLLGCRRLPAV